MRLISHPTADRRQNGPQDSAEALAEQLEFLKLAERLIRDRFETLLEHYRPAVERPLDDDEAVHQLRVSSRRLTAALQTLDSLFAERPREKLIRNLRRIRRAAGPARDLDVFRERVKSAEFPLKRKSRRRVRKFLKKRRRKAQKPLRRAFRKRPPEKLARIVDVLLASVSSHSDETAASGSRLVGAAVERYVSEAPTTFQTAADLHQLRICGKRLRYTLETLLDLRATPRREQAASLLDELKQVQDRLGRLNDSVVSRQRLLGWAEETRRDSLRRAFRKMTERESKNAEERTAEFFRWWSEERQQAFRRKLDELGS
jgi:CHAD domain-containing protein